MAPGWKLRIGTLPLVLVVTAYVILVDNRTFWSKAADALTAPSAYWGFVIALGSLCVGLLLLVSSKWLLKPFLVLVLVLSAVTSYYVDTFGAVIDLDMIRNTATTTVTESRHLVTGTFALHVGLFGLIPAILVGVVRVEHGTFWRKTFLNGGLSVILIIAAIGALYPNYQTYAAVFRERRDLMASFQPGAPIVNAIRFAKVTLRTRNAEIAKLGADARPGPALAGAVKPVVLVMVIGETARAQDFSIDGYARQTNPELSQLPIINFPQVQSCGTATAVSLPCLFSPLGRSDYSFEKAVASENLLDVFAHAGFDVVWWDNNTGDKKIAARVRRENFTNAKDPDFCASGECDDGILLNALKEELPDITRNTVIVIHQIGSHGPAYFLRYPPEYEVFAPACHSVQLGDCTLEEIVNAYDDTIYYTDHIIAGMIDALATDDQVIPALFYVSDHGESLGESGLFLHGAPYRFAPDTQTHVPMLAWLSPDFEKTLGLNAECLRVATREPTTHDTVFHSMLGLMGIETAVRRPDLDWTADCRAQGS